MAWPDMPMHSFVCNSLASLALSSLMNAAAAEAATTNDNAQLDYIIALYCCLNILEKYSLLYSCTTTMRIQQRVELQQQQHFSMQFV